MNTTIKSLRQAGNKVRCVHSRYKLGDNQLFSMYDLRKAGCSIALNSRGGFTQIDVTTKDGKDFSASAKCSLRDSFNRRTAVSIALGRLEKQMAA